MTYKEKARAVEEKLKKLQQIEPLNIYVRDGIVNIDSWTRQAIRPLFIGKEAHGDGFGQDSWSITKWLDEDPLDVCISARHSWQKTAYISHGLQNNFMLYDDIPFIRNDARVADALRAIAFINVGKYGAETRTPWSRLDALYQQNRSALHDQIELYQPNVIIGWNTLSFFERDAEFLNRFGTPALPKQALNSVDYWSANGKLFIDAYHPASFQISQEQYVDDIIQAVKLNMNQINTALPRGIELN